MASEHKNVLESQSEKHWYSYLMFLWCLLVRGESLLEDTATGLDRVYMDMFLAELRTCVDGIDYKGYLFAPISMMDELQIDYPNLISKEKYTKLNTLQDYKTLLSMI
jgi:hypothetical protein